MNRKKSPERHEETVESPRVTRSVARFLLDVHGGTQEDFARDAGPSLRTVSRCLKGEGSSGATLRKLAAAAGLTPWELDGLIALTRAAHARREAAPQEGLDLLDRGRWMQASADLAGAFESYLASRIDQLRARLNPAPPGPLSREAAAAVWARLQPYPEAVRRVLIEQVSDFQAWELAELLCDRSLASAPDEPGEALELADLAVQVATMGPDAGPRNARLAYTWAHRGNALCAAGDHDGAEKALRTARRYWQKRGHADAGLPVEERLLGFETALRDGCLVRAGSGDLPV